MTNIDKTMNTNETEVIDSTIDTETTENQEVELVLEEETTEDVESLKKTIETLKAQKDHWKNKANKPVETKEAVAIKPVAQDTGMNQKDLIAIVKSGIEDEDIEVVQEYAQLKKISISEALKSTVVKSILSEKDEERKTANASNTGKARVGSTKMTDETLLSNASKGIYPEKDEDIERLIMARKAKK